MCFLKDRVLSGKPEIINQALVGERDMALFEAAIRSMPCAFNLWDEKLNLVLFNQLYLDIYELPKSLVKKGLPLRDLLKYRLESGSIPAADLDDIYEEARTCFYGDEDTNHPVHLEKIPDGRTIRIGVMFHTGVGWVVTHEDISESINRLEEIKFREAELQLQNNRFEAAVGSMAHGLAMFNADEKLVICNDAYLDIYRLPHEFGQSGTAYADIIKHRTKLVENSGVVGDTNEIPINFIERVKNLQPDDAPLKYTWEFENGQHVSVMYDSTGDGGWVSTHEDVTLERQRANAIKKREADLQLQYSRFDAAVDNMAHGLAMFDGDKKLVVCNQEYMDMYMLPQELGVPGASFAKIIEYRQKNGMVYKDGVKAHHEKFAKTLDEKIPQMEDFEMVSGKIISILHRVMVGGGWVSTHVDVTEERQKTKALELRKAELKQQNNRFDAAVNNMAHGLAMFDADEKLVICNAPYLEIYNLPKEFSKPGVLFKDIIEYRTTIGTSPKAASAEELNSMVHSLFEDIGQGDKPTIKVWEMENGQHVSVSYGSVNDGGWVSTHEVVTEQQLEVKKIRHLARHDALTNLPNRMFFAEHLVKADSHILRGEKMAILCLDLDHFKEINDCLGHGVGDEVLKQVAERLKNAIRDHEVVARMGGDEFVILVGPLDKPQQAALVAQRILKEFKTAMSIDGHCIRVGTSIGIAVSPMDGSDGATLMKNADRALYRSKDEGRGGFHFFEEGMDADIHFRKNMEQDIMVALDKGQFYLTYAPTLELESNRISACEAIVNWSHPKLGSLLCEDFVQVAQETGMCGKLISWIFEEALVQANTWPEQVRLSINLFAMQFGYKSLADVIKHAIEKTGFDPSRLEVGISEAHLAKYTTQTVKVLKEIRALGVLVGVSEFGKENSNLNNLRLFSFDKINLDSSFVSDISGVQENKEIAKAIVGLGQSLGITMNAQGVNKECQLDFMRELGCQEVQGHLFSPALPQHSICELLRTVELRAADKAGIKLSDVPLDRVMDL